MSQGDGIYRLAPADGPLLQGEILSDVRQVILNLASIGSPDPPIVDYKNHPLVIIVSQDCDLDQDFKKGPVGTMLPNILLCEVETAEQLRALLKASVLKPGEQWDRLKRNNEPRYQFLEKVPMDRDATGREIPELGIDFKRYFTLPAEELYRRLEQGTPRAQRRCVLNSPYLEHFCQRFFSYQARVALDPDHESE